MARGDGARRLAGDDAPFGAGRVGGAGRPLLARMLRKLRRWRVFAADATGRGRPRVGVATVMRHRRDGWVTGVQHMRIGDATVGRRGRGGDATPTRMPDEWRAEGQR